VVEYLKVFHHVGFFRLWWRWKARRTTQAPVSRMVHNQTAPAERPVYQYELLADWQNGRGLRRLVLQNAKEKRPGSTGAKVAPTTP
jgi:hypothetical protein